MVADLLGLLLQVCKLLLQLSLHGGRSFLSSLMSSSNCLCLENRE